MPSSRRSTPGRTRCCGGRRGRPARRRVGCPRQVHQVRPLGVIQLKGSGHSLEHRVRDAADAAAFQPGVVVRAHPGELRHFLPAQARHAAQFPVAGDAGLLRADLRATRDQELTDVVFSVHIHHATQPKRPVAVSIRHPQSRPPSSVCSVTDAGRGPYVVRARLMTRRQLTRRACIALRAQVQRETRIVGEVPNAIGREAQRFVEGNRGGACLPVEDHSVGPGPRPSEDMVHKSLARAGPARVGIHKEVMHATCESGTQARPEVLGQA